MTSTVPEQPAASGPVYNLRYIWFISLVAAMGGLLFGYDWVVIGGAKPFFEKYFQLDHETLSGWANSWLLLGCLLGSLAAGGLSDKLAARACWSCRPALCRLLGAHRLGVDVHVVCRLADLGGRGHRHGLESFADVHRGGLAGAFSRTVGGDQPIDHCPRHFGGPDRQLADCAKGARMTPPRSSSASSWNGQYGWRWMFTAVTVPSLLFFVGARLLPESPRWLVKNGLADLARRILARIGGAVACRRRVADIQGTIASERSSACVSAICWSPRCCRILLVGMRWPCSAVERHQRRSSTTPRNSSARPAMASVRSSSTS